MNKLRSSQIFMILFLNAAFSFLCQNAPFTIEGIFGALIGTAAVLLLCMPMGYLYHRNFSFTAYASSHRILPLCFVFYFLIQGGISFLHVQETSQTLSLPVTGKFMAAALIAIVCLYTSSLGIQALARSSTLIFGVLLFTLAVMFLGAIPQAEPQNLSLSEQDTIFSAVLRTLSSAEELPVLFLLLNFVEQPKFRTIVHVWIGKLLLFLYISLLSMAVLGDLMMQSNFPFFSTTAISQPFSTQRADALYFVLFVLLSIFRITLYTVLSSHFLQIAIPKIQHSSSISLILMLIISWASAMLSLSPLWNIPILILFALFVPLYFLLHKKRGTAI